MRHTLARCPHCIKAVALSPSGMLKGAALLAGLAALRLHPVVGLAVGLAGFIWGDKLEMWLKARCPECRSALTIVGELYRPVR